MSKLKPYTNYQSVQLNFADKLPEGWEILRGKFVFKEINERSVDGKEQLLSVSEHKGVVPRDSINVNMFQAENYTGYKLCNPGDVVINSLWAWHRGIGVAEHRGIVSTAYSVHRLRKPNKWNYKYLTYLLRTNAYVGEYLIRSKGIWDSRLQLTGSNFQDIQIVIPPLETQNAIVAYLDRKTLQIQEFIAKKERLIELLEEQKSSVIRKYVTKGVQSNSSLKPSNVDWIGDIPKHWQIKKLKYCSKIIYGISPHESTYNDKGIGTVLINGPVEYSEENFGYTRELKWTTDPKKFAPKDALLFCLRGSTTGRLNICHNNVSIGRGVAAIISETDQEFMIFAMKSLVDFISDSFKGSTFPSVTSEDLNNYLFSNKFFCLKVLEISIAKSLPVLVKIKDVFGSPEINFFFLKALNWRSNLRESGHWGYFEKLKVLGKRVKHSLTNLSKSHFSLLEITEYMAKII